MLFLLLIGGAAAVAGVYYGKQQEEKLVDIAQNHRARAARLQVEYERCSRQLATAKANDQMTPKVMMSNDEETEVETGEDEGNL